MFVLAVAVMELDSFAAVVDGQLPAPDYQTDQVRAEGAAVLGWCAIVAGRAEDFGLCADVYVSAAFADAALGGRGFHSSSSLTRNQLSKL